MVLTHYGALEAGRLIAFPLELMQCLPEAYLPKWSTFLIEQSDTFQIRTVLSDEIVAKDSPFAAISHADAGPVKPTYLQEMVPCSQRRHSPSGEPKS